MADMDKGRMDYIRQRFAEAATPEDVIKIRHALIVDEKLPRGTVDTVKNEMRERGELPGTEDSQSLVSLKRQFPQRLGRYDVLTPEGVLEQLRLQDGDYKVGFVDGIAMLLLAARLNQELANTQAAAMTPMINMLQTLRAEEKEAAERSRASASEAASIAAEQAVSRVLGYIDQKLPKGPPPKDMDEMFTKRFDKMWEMMEHVMEQKMFPGSTGKPPEGWEYERVSAPVETKSSEKKGTPPGWSKEQVKEEKHGVQSGDVRSQSPADGAGEGSGEAPEDGDTEVS